MKRRIMLAISAIYWTILSLVLLLIPQEVALKPIPVDTDERHYLGIRNRS
jgi:hypothetical protein